MTRKPANETIPPAAKPEAAAVETAGEGAPAEPLSANKASVARAAKAREDRLAAALRTNLSRRKAAARVGRDTDAGGKG